MSKLDTLLTVVIMPTFRCQLRCSYCVGRTLPMVTHGTEREPEEWIEALAACPREVFSMTASGGEATLYDGLPAILESVDWPIRLETNLMRSPKEWLTPGVASHFDYCSTSLHFHALQKQAAIFWKNLDLLLELGPDTLRVLVKTLVTQRDRAEDIDIIRQMAAERGLPFKAGNFCDTFLWREKFPLREPEPWCSAGYGCVYLMPDGTAYRCCGQAYYAREALGNVMDDSWDVLLSEPGPCDVALCTACNAHRTTKPEEAQVH